MSDFFDGFQFGDGFELTPDMLEDISGGAPTATSDRVFGALIRSCKKGGKSREEVAAFMKNSESLYNMDGMEGVTTDDAMDYLDKYWDKY